MIPSPLSQPTRPWWHLIILLGLALVFGYAGVLKLTHPAEFSQSVARYDLIPASFINLIALTLPGVEIVLAVGLLFPHWRESALWGVIGLGLVFAVALGSTIAREIPIACGCFSMDEKPSPHAAWWALGRDALILIAAFLIIRTPAAARAPSLQPDLI
jgi:uncharacterized membrane protein